MITFAKAKYPVGVIDGLNNEQNKINLDKIKQRRVLRLREVICNCAYETMKIRLNPTKVEYLEIQDSGVKIVMKAGYHRNLSLRKIQTYFGDDKMKKNIDVIEVGDTVRTPYDDEKPKEGVVIRISKCNRFYTVKKQIGTHKSATRVNEYFIDSIKLKRKK